MHENKINYIIVKEGDTFYKLSKELNISLWQLYKYNNLDNKSFIEVGDLLFLQPKRSKSSKRTHVVEKGDTLGSISQKYGVKLSSLYKRNKMTSETALEKGQKIKLK